MPFSPDPFVSSDETDFGYDVMKRRNRTVSPGGTITDLVYEPRGLVIGTYVGTNDDGGTETDPTGGGTDPDNNMVIVTANEYDDGADGGDGNLTQLTQYVNATTTRVTLMAFDFRDRLITTDGEIGENKRVRTLCCQSLGSGRTLQNKES